MKGALPPSFVMRSVELGKLKLCLGQGVHDLFLMHLVDRFKVDLDLYILVSDGTKKAVVLNLLQIGTSTADDIE